MGGGTGGTFRGRRSRVLWEITVLVVGVYIIGGLAAFLISSNSFDRLARRSRERLIEEKAQTISSSYDYLARAEMEMILATYGKENIDLANFYGKLLKADVNDLDPLQEFLIGKFQQMKEAGLLGLQYIFMVIPNPFTGELITFISNERGRIYMRFPENVETAIREGDSWLLVDEGLPGLGLEGEQLVTFTGITSPVEADITLTFIGITPMGEDITEIKRFYDDEKRSATRSYALVTLASVVVIILITFFLLRYLIRRRITEPIDILCEEAEKVMQGDLDIEVTVHKGGEFEGLETAFREMVVSFRKYIAKSVGEE